ncbi:hypothetical protein GQ457_06G002440 [Hibiscus cannabinus]
MSKQCCIFGCEKLTEVQDIFKLEPIENFEAQEIKRLFNVDSINKSRVQLYSFLIDRTRVATPQVLQECGITSTFVAGSEVSVGFKHISNEHQISFSLPTRSSPKKKKIHCFSLCIVFSIISQTLDFLPSVCISNETKKMTWNYRSSFIGVPKSNGNTMLWLIHWPTTNFELEGGDLVSCTVASIHLGIRKLGVTYESVENIAYQHGFIHSFPGDEDATRNSMMDLTKDLLSLGSYENVKVQVCNYLQESTVITSPQVLYDYGIITAFHPMPFDHYGRHFGHHSGKAEVSISVPPNSGRKTNYLLNSTIVLSTNDDRTFEFLPCLEVVNETEGTKWTYSKHFMGIPEAKNTMYWKVKFRLDLSISAMRIKSHFLYQKKRYIGSAYASFSPSKVSNQTFYQVLYDYGIITAFHPMPFEHYGRYFGHHSGQAEVSISVPPNSGRKTSCLLNSTIVLSANDDRTFEFLPWLEVVNETKGTKWTYSKHFMGIPETKNTIYWVVCWNFKGCELEAGDRISLRVVSDLWVLEFGVNLVYDHELDDRPNSFHLLPGMSTERCKASGKFSGANCGEKEKMVAAKLRVRPYGISAYHGRGCVVVSGSEVTHGHWLALMQGLLGTEGVLTETEEFGGNTCSGTVISVVGCESELADSGWEDEGEDADELFEGSGDIGVMFDGSGDEYKDGGEMLEDAGDGCEDTGKDRHKNSVS